jgi:hypothetical protein
VTLLSEKLAEFRIQHPYIPHKYWGGGLLSGPQLLVLAVPSTTSFLRNRSGFVLLKKCLLWAE